MNERFESFVDAVRMNPSVINQVHDREYAVAVMKQIVESKISMDFLLECTAHFSFGDELLGVVASKFRSTERWFEFVEAILKKAVAYVAEGLWDVSVLSALMDDPLTIEYLLTRHRKTILDPNCPISICNVDGYWEWKIRWYLAKKDFRRSWDEIKKASSGFFKGEAEDVLDFNPSDYEYPASKQLIARLVDELFIKLVEDGGITALLESDQMVDHHDQKGVYTTTTPKGQMIEKQYSIRTSRAWEMASEHIIATRIYSQRPYKFDLIGAKILKIDAHFRQRRDADRRNRVVAKMQK